jgi:hypothetical protein
VVPSAPEATSLLDLPPELAEIVPVWADLPEAIKAGILAMVKASVGAQNLETKNAGVEDMGK